MKKFITFIVSFIITLSFVCAIEFFFFKDSIFTETFLACLAYQLISSYANKQDFIPIRIYTIREKHKEDNVRYMYRICKFFFITIYKKQIF